MMLFFFFFKQKTAYEMRISDWSSDVCSSDLGQFQKHFASKLQRPLLILRDVRLVIFWEPMQEHVAATDPGRQQCAIAAALAAAGAGNPLLVEEATQVRVNQTAFHFLNRLAQRSEGRRVGKECVSTCRSRG